MQTNTKKSNPGRLRDLRVHEASLVDQPANPLCRVVLTKAFRTGGGHGDMPNLPQDKPAVEPPDLSNSPTWKEIEALADTMIANGKRTAREAAEADAPMPALDE